jgi:hypothetical protein
MASLQSSPSIPPAKDVAKSIDRAWSSIHCQATGLWQDISDRSTGKLFREALWKLGRILQQIWNLSLLLLLAAIAVVVGIWMLGFYCGYRLWEWLDDGQPTPSSILLKLSDVLLFPFRWTVIWLDKMLKETFGLDLKLTEKLPATSDKFLNESATHHD